MRLSFHGADRDVTGSCHLIEAAEKKVLIDCGLLQGSRELNEENAGAFGFDAGAIDFVLLTHAHLDHCGRLPLLAKRGFKGEIISTAATAELAKPIGRKPAAVTSVPVSIGNAVDSQANDAARTRSQPCSIFTTIISTAGHPDHIL